MISKRAALALVAPLIVASCITVNIAPATPAHTQPYVPPISMIDPVGGAPAPSPTRLPGFSPHPPQGWIIVTCGPPDPVWSYGVLDLQYGGCIAPASAAALLEFREQRAGARIDEKLAVWIQTWHSDPAHRPLEGPMTLSNPLAVQRIALTAAVRSDATVSECVLVARDKLVQASAAQSSALDATALAEAERDIARAAALIASVEAMVATCPG